MSGVLTYTYDYCIKSFRTLGIRWDDDKLMSEFPVGRLGFKVEGAGKRRIFAIPNGFKQALLRPAHDWSMSVLRLIPQDGTFDQTAPFYEDCQN